MTTKGNDDTYRCDCNIIHDGVIEKVRGNMPKEDTLMDLADAFKVFSDSTRLKILCALLQEEMSVIYRYFWECQSLQFPINSECLNRPTWLRIEEVARKYTIQLQINMWKQL